MSDETLGLDEAGRGCVLGPLVIGGFLAFSDNAETLRSAGADDSAAQPQAPRGHREALDSLGTSILRTITPQEIDAGNINTLEEAAVDIILETCPDHVIIDAPCNPRGIPALETRLSAHIRALVDPSQLTVQPKADAFPHCGAASIFARWPRRGDRRTGRGGIGLPLRSGDPRVVDRLHPAGRVLPSCVPDR